MTEVETVFKRKERKYIILEHTFDEIQNDVVKHVPILIYKEGFASSYIETTYLDSDEFLLFREYLLRRNFRFKVRFRRYGYSEAGFSDLYWVELKVKYNSISRKTRFMLPKKYFDDFLSGKDILVDVKELNAGLIDIEKSYELVSQLIKLNQLKPILRASYERVAFQNKLEAIRVTIDRSITHEKLKGDYKSETLGAIILEAKNEGKRPKWLKKMINKLSLLRQKRFSKFASGINSLYFPDRGKYNFSNDNNFVEDKTIPTNIQQSFELLKEHLELEGEIK